MNHGSDWLVRRFLYLHDATNSTVYSLFRMAQAQLASWPSVGLFLLLKSSTISVFVTIQLLRAVLHQPLMHKQHISAAGDVWMDGH
jgi:hypothetical protein